MPTLDQAARQLGISEKTLRKWMQRLGIERERHPQDWRYWLISDEQLQQIAEERAKMPTVTQQPDMPYLALRAKSDGLDSSADTFPIPTAKKRRQQPLSASHVAREMPVGAMGRDKAGLDHGIPTSTARSWAVKCERHPGAYGPPGRFQTKEPLTAEGFRQWLLIARRSADFHVCEDASCPCHEQIAEGEG